MCLGCGPKRAKDKKKKNKKKNKDGMCISKDLKEVRCQADIWRTAFLEGLRDSKEGEKADEGRTMGGGGAD